MALVGLVMYVAFIAVACGGRTWLQYRRTGDHGFRGLSGRPGSIAWLAGIVLAVGMTLAGAGPIAELLGLVQPWRGWDGPGFAAVGMVFVLLGFLTTVAAQLQMRDSWRIGVDERETTPLVTAGLFAIVRNPIFSGMMLVLTGLLLLSPNAVSAMALSCAVLGASIHVRLVEEPYLTRVHGDRYRSYARAVGRFLPWFGGL